MKALRVKDFVLTASDMVRIAICPASRVYTMKRDKPTAAMWWGIGMHKFLEKVSAEGRESALWYIQTKFPRMLRNCRSVDTTSLPDGRVEVEYIIDIRRDMAHEASYFEAMPELHYYGRADLISEMKGLDHVTDYKSGKPEEQKLRPEGNNQLMLLALARLLINPQKGVYGSICVVPSQAAAKPESVKPEWRTTLYTAPELLSAFKPRARRLHLEVLESRAELQDEKIVPDFVPGEHCRGCKLEAFCASKDPGT